MQVMRPVQIDNHIDLAGKRFMNFNYYIEHIVIHKLYTNWSSLQY